MISLTRRYRFSASHRLHSPQLNREENVRLYGKCNNPFGHGHDYVLEITIAAAIDPRTGLLLPVSRLDAVAEEKVLAQFRHRNLNLDLPYFADLVPTTENIALVIARILQEDWDICLGEYSVRLVRVHVQETDRNGFTLLLHQSSSTEPEFHDLESVQLHV